jgi:hypothetical protein
MAKGQKTGGRKAGVPNKATREIKALAQSYGPAAIRELARLAKAADSETARVSAIKELLDRAYGKAPQAVQHSGQVGTYDLTKVKDDELEALEAILRAATVTGGGNAGESEEG